MNERLVYSGKTLVCTSARDGEFAVLRFNGIVTRQDLGLATDMVCELADLDSRFMVLDLSDVPMVDDFGQGLLMAIVGIANGIGLLSAAVVSPTARHRKEIFASLHGAVPIYGSIAEFRNELFLLAGRSQATRH